MAVERKKNCTRKIKYKEIARREREKEGELKSDTRK